MTNRLKVLSLLEPLLLDEYLQRDVYDTYSYYLFGLCSPKLQEHLSSHRTEEDKHIKLLQRYMMSLRAAPLLKRLPIPVINPPIGNILFKNLELEMAAVAQYSKAVLVLDALKDPAFVSLKVDLENILIEEQEHVHDLQQWLREDIRSEEAKAAGKVC
jgi:bacterioferritin (cytochrome b1)